MNDQVEMFSYFNTNWKFSFLANKCCDNKVCSLLTLLGYPQFSRNMLGGLHSKKRRSKRASDKWLAVAVAFSKQYILMYGALS